MIRSTLSKTEYSEGYRAGVSECFLVVLNSLAENRAYAHLIDPEFRTYVDVILDDIQCTMVEHFEGLK
jgi:hypothetical protein